MYVPIIMPIHPTAIKTCHSWWCLWKSQGIKIYLVIGKFDLLVALEEKSFILDHNGGPADQQCHAWS